MGYEGIARAQTAKGNRAQALQAYLESVRQANSLRSKFQSEEFKTGLFGDFQKVFDTALALSLDTQEFDETWNLSEASRARQLLDTIRQRTTDTLSEQRIGLSELQQGLARGEAVLQFHVLESRTVVWQITRVGVSSWVLPVGFELLSAKVDAFRTSIIERRRSALGIQRSWG